MSNKYEREIEEILRNLERTEPKAGSGRQSGERLRRKTKIRRRLPVVHLGFAEWCLTLAIIAALVSGGWAYANGLGNLVTGIIALIGAVFVILVAISTFLEQPRYSGPRRYTNVTPLRSGFFSRVRASWQLLMLKLRYRQRKDREH